MNDRPPREIDDRLADWVDGRMSTRERDHFVAELRVNAQLRQDLADYERTVGVLRAALRAPSAPSPMADRVLAAIAAGRAGPAVVASRRWTWRHLGWSLASAAAVLALAFWIDAASGAPRERRELAVHDEVDPTVVTLAPDAAGAPAASPRPGSAGDADRGQGGDGAVRRLVAGEVVAGLPAATSSESVAPDATKVEEAEALATGAAGKADGKALAPAEEVAAAGGGKDKGASLGGTRRAPAPSGPAGPGATPTSTPTAPMAPAPGASTVTKDLLRKQPADAPSPGAERSAGASGFLAFVLVEGPVREARTLDDTAKKPAADPSGPTRDLPNTTTGARGTESAGVRNRLGAAAGAPPALADAALAAALDEFLAQADHGDAVAAQWPTMRGELQASPLIDDVLQQVEPPARGEAATATKNAAPPALDRGWLVEGERQDVELLLQRLAALSRDRGWALRPGEVRMPKELRALAPSPTAGSGVDPGKDDRSAATTDRMRIVVRLRLRAR